LKCSAGGHTLRCRYFLGGTLSQSSGDYRWTNERYYSTTESITGSQSDNLFDVHTNWNTAIQEGGDTILFGMLYLHNPADTDIMTFFEGTTMSGDGSNRPTISRFGVFNNQAGGAAEIACTGLRFFQSSGNLNSGKFVIYGIKD